jgi:hypothetical protein
MPRFRVLQASALPLLVAVLGACSSDPTTTPGAASVLAGAWYRANTSFEADTGAATYSAPCLDAAFAPIALDSAGSFRIESTTLVQAANLMQAPGDRLHINGLLVGDSLSLTVYVVHQGGGVTDPVSVTLPPGTGEKAVCTS